MDTERAFGCACAIVMRCDALTLQNARFYATLCMQKTVSCRDRHLISIFLAGAAASHCWLWGDIPATCDARAAGCDIQGAAAPEPLCARDLLPHPGRAVRAVLP